MIGMENRTIHSKNLTFRLLRQEDKPFLYPILQEPETTRPAGFPPVQTEEAFERFWNDLTQYNTAVAILLEDRCIGYYHVHKYRTDNPELKDKQCVGIGFLIGRHYCRRGFGTETLLTMDAFLLERFDCIFADSFSENTASRKTIEKCGFRFLENYEMFFAELGERKQVVSNVLTRQLTAVGKPEGQSGTALPAVTIREAVPGDEKVLAFIQTQSWKAAFRDIIPADTLARLTDCQKAEEMYTRVLENPEIRVGLESVDGMPHGITAWSKNRYGLGDDTAELICIHSLPEGWGRGFGSFMLERALGEMTRAGFTRAILWVFAENSRARRFYEKHGFSLTGKAQTAYGAEEVMYQKQLIPQEAAADRI